MPTQAPVFRQRGYRDRKPWQLQPGAKDVRKRGRAGLRERAEVLAEEPFCRACLTSGRHVGSDEVDHIVPLSEGGNDERSNKQALCTPCHDAKSKAERARARSA